MVRCSTCRAYTRRPTGMRTFPVGIFPAAVISPSRTIPPLFTWCRTYPFHHHHPPVFNIKRSTVNVYKIDRGRSVRVRTTGLCQFSNFRFKSRGMSWVVREMYPRGGTVRGICPRWEMSSECTTLHSPSQRQFKALFCDHVMNADSFVNTLHTHIYSARILR